MIRQDHASHLMASKKLPLARLRSSSFARQAEFAELCEMKNYLGSTASMTRLFTEELCQSGRSGPEL